MHRDDLQDVGIRVFSKLEIPPSHILNVFYSLFEIEISWLNVN